MTPEKTVREHVMTLHLIGEQLSQVENWMWQHLADVRATASAAPTPRRAVPLSTPCLHCSHPYNWHASRGACEFGNETNRCGCTTFLPGERPEPIDPRRILGAEAPVLAEDDSLRFLRRESFLVLLTRLQRGRTLTEDEARALRQHVETEISEANEARAEAKRLGLMVDEYSDGARHLSDVLRTEKERADAAIERETVLEGEIEAQQGAVERVRKALDDRPPLIAGETGKPASEYEAGWRDHDRMVRAALDGPTETENSTT